MNQSMVFGLLGGLVVLIGMMIMSPDQVGAFFSIPGLLVVIGGTLAATFVSRPIAEVSRALRALPDLFREEKQSTETDVAQLLQFARRYRSGNPRAAERELGGISNPFLRAGLRQMVDGCRLEDLSKSVQWRMSSLRNRDQSQTQILYTMAVFAPAFGMLGTLFGLVHMLSGLGDSGLNELGGTMAFAMITTVYGIVASNLFFKPLAIKMERRTQQRLTQMKLLAEGMLLVFQKRHPTIIQETLESMYIHPQAPAPAPGHLALVKA